LQGPQADICFESNFRGTGRGDLSFYADEFSFRHQKGLVMSDAKEYRRQAEEVAARIEWCERKLSFERKRHRALKDLAAGEDWLEGKISPTAEPKAGRTDKG
jgi:hypothetical protein